MKSCPFCGNADIEIHQGQQGITFLLCGDDVGNGGCGAIVSFRPCLSGSAAVAAYDRRAEVSPCA